MISLLVSVVLVSLVGLTVAAVVATRSGVVDAFELPATSDPSADTLAGESSLVKTALAPPTWNVRTLTNLRQVEDLLDCLEVQGFAEREVLTLSNTTFAVRWR